MAKNNSTSTNQKRNSMKELNRYDNEGYSYLIENELNGIDNDFDWNTEYGDGDIPDIDEP